MAASLCPENDQSSGSESTHPGGNHVGLALQCTLPQTGSLAPAVLLQIPHFYLLWEPFYGRN